MHSFKLTRRELAHEADRQALLNSQQNLCSTFFSIRFNQLDRALGSIKRIWQTFQAAILTLFI